MKTSLNLNRPFTNGLILSTYLNSKITRAPFQEGDGAFFCDVSKKGTIAVVPLNDKAELVTAHNVNLLLFQLNLKNLMAKTGEGKKKVYVKGYTTKSGKKIPTHYRSTPD